MGSIPCWSLWLHLFLPRVLCLLTPLHTHQTSCCSSNLPSSVQTQGLCTCCSLIWNTFPQKEAHPSLHSGLCTNAPPQRGLLWPTNYQSLFICPFYAPARTHQDSDSAVNLTALLEWTPRTSSPHWNFSSFSSNVFLPSCSSFLPMDNASFHYSDPRLGTLYFPHTQHPISNAAGSTVKTILGF